MPETISSQKLTYNLKSLRQVVQTLINEGKSYCIWLFYGDVGAGKTTLIKAICEQMGADHTLLSSPTFSIINEYPTGRDVLYHFDFYRLKNEEQILDLGIEEYFYSGRYCFVEWPERLGQMLPTKFFKISVSHSNLTDRIIELEKHG